MRHRWIVRERKDDITTPHIELGLFSARRLARTTAKRLGYPPKLIKKVTRHAPESH